ncbi:MAG TPA: hypothetical protein VFH13_04195 [Gemmatimonadaceae bacterium]|jgi:hypothetical protein|nr:hypothetical protein [Gemmatimonadaceae bacterium]
MIEHDFPEDFVPIAAELQRLPYLSPSRGFADRVISRIDRLQPAQDLAPVLASRHLELHQGGRQAVSRPRPRSLVRATGRATAGVALIAAAAFMLFEVNVLTAILAAASTQYAFAIAAVGAQVGALVLGPEAIAYLQAGALQAVLLYLTLAVGLFGGYAAIRTAAYIAKRKAA